MARYDRLHRGYYDVKNIHMDKTKDDTIIEHVLEDGISKNNTIVTDIKRLRISAISLLIISFFGLISIGINQKYLFICTEKINILISCYVIYALLMILIICFMFITLCFSLGSSGEM